MMKKEIVKKVVMITLVILLTLNFTTTEFENVVNENGAENVCLNLLNLKQSAVITSNEQLEALEYVTGTGTDIDPYIITRDYEHISIRNLTAGKDNIVVRDSCAITVSIDNRNTTIINCTFPLVPNFKIIGENIELYDNNVRKCQDEYIVVGSHNQLNLTMEGNNFSTVNFIIDAISVGGVVRENMLRSINWGNAKNYLMIYDNYIVNQKHDLFWQHYYTKQFCSNFYENYLDIYPNAKNNGIFWNKEFGEFDNRPLCKNPLDPFCPPIPNLYLTTTMIELTNENRYDLLPEGWETQLDFNKPYSTYIKNLTDDFYINLNWECLDASYDDLYYEVYLNTFLLAKTQETEYSYHFNGSNQRINFSVVANYEPFENESHKALPRSIYIEVFQINVQPKKEINASILGIPVAGVIYLVWIVFRKNNRRTV